MTSEHSLYEVLRGWTTPGRLVSQARLAQGLALTKHFLGFSGTLGGMFAIGGPG